MAVYIHDPNDLNINPNIVNSIPQYQDMYIFAELTAKQNGRSIFITTEEGTFSSERYSQDNVTINFLGVNQDINSPDFKRMTTNWYDGSTKTSEQYEGFGISRIDVVINSSFIPQVNIEFIDIKGYAFFNQNDSPYRILFDFPPPIFELTIKGYFGKAIKYKLHLVKYTTGFKSENGNFIINAQFVAVTFAPLSDVLFKYVVNVPLIEKGVNLTPDGRTKPKNTYELIIKLKDLYSTGGDLIDSSREKKIYEKTIKEINILDTFFYIMSRYKNNQYLKELGDVYYAQIDKSNTLPQVKRLSSLNEYQDFIKSISKEGIPTNPTSDLYLLINMGEITTETKSDDDIFLTPLESVTSTTEILSKIPTSTPTNFAKKKFNEFKKETLENRLTFRESADIKDGDLSKAMEFQFYDGSKTIKYVGLNLTTIFIKLYNYRNILTKRKIEAANILKGMINDIVYDKLGMNPTIFNIFEIILNDVDIFFDKLHSVAREAKVHHNDESNFKNIIFNSDFYKDTRRDDFIYPFPLIIQRTPLCGGKNRPADELNPDRSSSAKSKEERIAPLELNKLLGAENEFPETDFVYDFIETYLKQGQIYEELNMKGDTNEEGNNKWSPISPVDSNLNSGDVVSPYVGAAFSTSGKQQQIIFRAFLNRFYILSQYVLNKTFYTDNQLRNLYAESEAINLSLALFNIDLLQNLILVANTYKDNVSGFYTYLNNELELEEYNFSGSKESINLSNTISIYNDKSSDDFVGLKIDETNLRSVDYQDPTSVNSLPLKNFYQNVVIKKFQQEVYWFTNENLIYLRDWEGDKIGDIITETKYLVRTYSTFGSGDKGVLFGSKASPDLFNFPAQVEVAINGGNNSRIFISADASDDSAKNKLLKQKGEFLNIWSGFLGNRDNDFYDRVLNTDNNKLIAIVLLSNFGYTLSSFDNSEEGKLNDLIFKIPSVIEVPDYLIYYLGALVDITTDSEIYQQLYDYCYTIDSGMNVNGLRIFADIHDVNSYLSKNDKKAFKEAFEDFYDLSNPAGKFRTLKTYLLDIIEGNKDLKSRKKRKAYEDDLKNATNFDKIVRPLIQRQNILNYSDLTFNMEENTESGFKSLATVNSNSSLLTINNKFFKTFLSKLNRALEERISKIYEEEKRKERLLNDKDIISETYYSFKNIHDKWLSGVGEKPIGYPYNNRNTPNPKLINLFAFVDRGMNPIGNTILNPEMLINMFDDPTASVFTIISQLLSLNGFEFFPLQNFMYDNLKGSADGDAIPKSWEDSFKIDVSGVAKTSPAFICMYIGGTSSYPTGIGQYGLFEDDGIIDLELDPPTDIGVGECGYISPDDPDDRQKETNPNFPWSQVRAFRVRFGEQNQTMFTGIKIDSKEYPETNESIQILSRLAGDNGATAPIPKGQNLYTLYENRSYKATVEGLGNAMIQPTQYFQIDNVPMYNGAYIILTVEHSIEQNFMRTSFSGTKLLRYPVPRVLEPFSIIDYNGIADDTNIPNISSGEFTTTIDDSRLIELDSVFGIDIYHRTVKNGSRIEWDKLKENNPPVQFIMIKATQGSNHVDDELNNNAQNAVKAGLKVGYYHFAEPHKSTTTTEIKNNAIEQATNFINTVNELVATNESLKPELQLAVDLENDDSDSSIYWTNNKNNNNLWLETFINQVRNNSEYGIMIYVAQDFFNTNFSTTVNNTPLWVANWKKDPNNDPLIPNGWNNNEWIGWQFSRNGVVAGCYPKNHLDINVFRKDYFNNASNYYNLG